MKQPIHNMLPLNILLCDDDTDDCIFFKDALEGLSLSTHLTTVHDGEQLMELITKTNELPYVLFLDLNMPRKNGFECLSEIKLNKKLKQLPVIILSTSIDEDVVNLLYNNGAQYCASKPGKISQLKIVIRQTLTLIAQNNIVQPSRENFVITAQNSFVFLENL